jgi:hypothetical protein
MKWLGLTAKGHDEQQEDNAAAGAIAGNAFAAPLHTREPTTQRRGSELQTASVH